MVLYQLFANGGMLSPGEKRRHLVDKKFMLGDVCRQMLHKRLRQCPKFYAHSRLALGIDTGPPTLSRQGLILIVLCLVFHLSSAAAVPVIKETACDLEVSGECEAIFGPDVVCGNAGYCECLSSDDVPVGDRCRNKCATEARKLHDMDRRIKNYKNVIGEPPLTDYEIAEGWYSLDEYKMMTEGTGNLTGGSCGTRYQIVIKEGTTIDWDTLDLTGVTLTATVYGRPTGHGEDIEIRVRKCEDAFQYYLKPPSIRLAAYCFDPMMAEELTDEEEPLVFPDSVWVDIVGSLHFREELRQDVWFDVPYVIWTCRLLADNPPTEDSSTKELFISVTWYVGNARVKAADPQTIANDTYDEYTGWRAWASANLTEDDLLNAGYSLGVTIVCGVQLSQGAKGKQSDMFTGKSSTNLHSYIQDVRADHIVVKLSSQVPLGCAAPVGAEEQTCALKLRIIKDDGALVCSDNPATENQHEACGVTLFGRTKNFTLGPDQYIDGTSIKENEGIYVLWKSSEEVEGTTYAFLSLAVANNTAGHALWNNYRINNVEIGAAEHIWYFYVSIYQNSLPTVEWWPWPHLAQISLTFEEAGKYILFRNGRIPFMVEVELEPTAEGGLSFCGVYLRYGNDIYTYSYCGGVFISGLIFGHGYYLQDAFDDYEHLVAAGLSMSVSRYRGYLWTSFYVANEFKSIEGIVGGGGRDKMLGRDGHIYIDDISRFLRSWRIDDTESLSNPNNHIHYSWISNYSSCGCPSKRDDIPERITSSINNDNVYTGVILCDLNEFCIDKSVGKDWPASLMPNYAIREVKIECEQRTDRQGAPFLWFTCQFHTISNKLYTVEWYIDGVMFRRLNAVKPATDIFGLADDELETNFALDVKIQCSVNVLDDNRNVLIGPMMSQILQPIHFTSTEIILQRGRDGYITWTNYIPFRCNDGYVECEMELQFYDPNDAYDCTDSTIAFKPGSKVQATSTVSASTGNVITTTIATKNNDKYELKSEFELRVIVRFRGTGRSTWTQLLRTVFLKVKVVTEPLWIGMDCHLHVDPHAKTADGKYYEMQYIGMFVLAKHMILPIQIQVVTMACSTWGLRPTCACALVFQAGRDIYLIDRCEGARFNGFLLQDDDILDVYETSDTRYQIIFPDLMMADVYVYPSFNHFMNVDIYPSPNEMHNLVGLCGNFNGDTSDDFRLRDTGNQGSIEGFSLSWELLNTGRWESDSLLEAKNYLNSTAWNSEEILCVYPNATDEGNRESGPLCSANEEQTCTKSKSHQGKKLNQSRRPRRETGANVDMDTQRRVQRLKRNVFKQHAIQREKRDDIKNINSMNETDARRLCIKHFANSSIYQIADKPISAEPYIEDCVLDLMATGDEEWAKPHIAALTTRNEIALEKDIVYAQSNSQVVEAMKQICTHDCNGHGVCIGNDQCMCEPGWGRKSCLIEVAVPPRITYITGYGTCDTSTETCLQFIIETDGVVELFYSKVVSLEAQRTGTFVIIDEFFIEVPALSLNEGLIDISRGRRRRTATSDSIFARQYGVAVSNDGINYGNITYVTVLDARCQETSNDTNGDTIVILSAGYCFIDGACYSEGNSSEGDICKICRTATNLFDWTDENCPETSPSISAHDNVRLYAITFSVFGVVLVIIITSVALWRRHIKTKRPVTPLPATVPYRGQTPLDPIDLGIPEAILKEITGSAPRADERMPSMHKN